MAHPISRAALFWGRLLALGLATLLILACSWLGLYIPSSWTPLDVGWLELLWPYLALFGALALLLSLLLPSRRLAATAAGMALAGSYFVTSLARVIASLEAMAQLSPLSYYQGGEALDVFNAAWCAGLLAAALFLAALAWRRFQGRDVRVGGEGGWNWPALARLLPRRLTLRRFL